MTSQKPTVTVVSAEPGRAWVGRVAQLVGPVVLAGALIVRADFGGSGGSTVGTIAVLAIVPIAAAFVVERVRRFRTTVARSRRGSKVLVGYGTPDLVATLAVCGIDARRAASSSALVALVLGRDTLEVILNKGRVSALKMDWSDVTSVTMGRSLLGGRQQPTVQIDIFAAARIAVIPAAGTWWTTLIPTKAVTTRLAQRIESLRKAAVERAEADTNADADAPA
jgi:hypothetical protein